ncbi:MAG: hypothetical protein L3J47_01310 [Sulfurovum sp.]|nr:hypothetical protein [Sulfurovum sp.]
MMNQKPTLTALLENSKNKKLLFLGKEGIFTQKEIDRFLKPYGITATKMLEEDVAGVIEGHRLNPVEQDISDDAYAKGLPLYKLTEFEELLSNEIDDDALLMAIKLGNDQERVVRLLGNEHLSDGLFVRLLKLYRFDEADEDNRQDRDVVMYTLRRYIDIRPSEEDLLYSYLTLRRLATEAVDAQLLDALLNFPNFEFLVRGKESVTLRQTIAANPHVDEALIRKLLSFRDRGVERSLAGNRSVPLEVLKHLFSRNDAAVDKAMATNPNIDDEIFGALLERANEEVTALLLVHQPVTLSRYEQILAADTNEAIFALLGANESLEKDVVEKLMEIENEALRETLAGNASLHPSMLETIYQEGEGAVHLNLAKNPTVPVWILEALFEERGDETAMAAALAHNPSLPEPMLRKLFERDDLEINRGLATNASLPLDLLDILKIDTRLQNELAQNENLAKSYEEVLGQKKAMMNV